MKVKGLIILILFLTSLEAIAEYNAYQIKFIIELNDGSEIQAFTAIPSGYINNNEIPVETYLEENPKSLLQNFIVSGEGETKYFANRIKYTFDCGGDSKCWIYKVIDPKTLDFNSINCIDVLEIIDQSYISTLSSKHTIEDQEWMNSEPVERHRFGGLLCSSEIFIHKKTSKTDAIIKKLKKYSETLEVKAKQLESSKDEEVLYKKADHEIGEIILEFDKLSKVVVITECTC